MRKPRVVAIVFGVFLVAALVIAATSSGIGKDGVSEGDVAMVDGTGISQEDFDAALKQAASQQGGAVPEPGTDQYDQLRDAALGQLLDAAWISGEAKSKGVEASEREVADQLAQTKKENFKTEQEFQDFITKSGLTPEDVDERITLQLLSQKLEAKINEDVPTVSDSEAEDYYNENKAQFEQPATRDIRLILNEDTAKVDEAKAALEADPSDANWKKVAAEFSTDATTKDAGGVRPGITPGVLEGDLDGAVFDAPVNQIEGPVTTPLGTYIFEVTKDTPATTQPFTAVKDQLVQQLQGQKQQEVFSTFIEDYRAKWTDLTICADGFIIDRCDNFKGTAAQPCTPEIAAQTGCPPPVNSRSPIGPGADTALGSSGGGGAPQGPHPAGEGTAPAGGAAGALPGGVPPGAGGAAPQGAAPQGAAPQGAAPQGAAPQGAAPQGAAPQAPPSG